MPGSEVRIDSPDGSFMGYLCRPASGGGPGLVVIQEVFGVNAVMRQTTEMFAEAGFLALCPDLFWRQEPGVQISDQTEADWQKALALYRGFDADKGVDDVGASLLALRATEGCTGRLGATGYCLGGLLAYLTACRTHADCAVGYYGVGLERHLDEAAALRGALLLHIAEEDSFVSKEAQADIKQALAAHPKVTIHSYPGRGHAFCRHGGEHFDQPAADLANARSLAFLRQHLT